MRKDALSSLGKELTRRSRAKCELCGQSGISLTAKEIPPVGEAPEVDKTLFLCKRCEEGVDGGNLQPETWRFLEAAVWSQLPAAQVAAVRICRRLAGEDIAWATDTISNLYLEPEVEEWIKA